MDDTRPRKVLIVANRTAATPALLAEVRRRASEGACRFTLRVPRPFWDADTEESAITLELAIPLLEDAAGSRVEGLVGAADPFLAVTSALEADPYDEIIVSTLPAPRLPLAAYRSARRRAATWSPCHSRHGQEGRSASRARPPSPPGIPPYG
jgi:hypothetical protein